MIFPWLWLTLGLLVGALEVLAFVLRHFVDLREPDTLSSTLQWLFVRRRRRTLRYGSCIAWVIFAGWFVFHIWG